MKLHNGTGSYIVIVGVLTKIISIKMDEFGGLVTEIQVVVSARDPSRSKYYTIWVLEDDALKIHSYGFPGLYLRVEGSFRAENDDMINTIVAEKIVFLDGMTPASSSFIQKSDVRAIDQISKKTIINDHINFVTIH